MINSNKLKGKLVEENLTQEGFASQLGIATFTLNEKINNKREFTASELRKIKYLLNLADDTFLDIFFNPEREK